MDGLPGDIVALALPLDVQKIAEAKLIARDWQVHSPPGHEHGYSVPRTLAQY